MKKSLVKRLEKLEKSFIEQRIRFNKDQMIQLLCDYANALYVDNPPKSVYDDNSRFVRDFVEGYYSEEFNLNQPKENI